VRAHLELIRNLQNWKVPAVYLAAVEGGVEGNAEAIQHIWQLCDAISRLRVGVAALFAAVGSTLLAIFAGIMIQLVTASQLPSWYWVVWAVLCVILASAVASWWIAYNMLEIASRVVPYFRDEITDRWLGSED